MDHDNGDAWIWSRDASWSEEPDGGARRERGARAVVEALRHSHAEAWLGDPSARREWFCALTVDQFSVLVLQLNGLLRGVAWDRRRFTGAEMRVGPWVAPAPADRPGLLAQTLQVAQRCAARGAAEPALERAALVAGGGLALLHALPDANGRTARVLSLLIAEGYDEATEEAVLRLAEPYVGRAAWSVGAETMSPVLGPAARAEVQRRLEAGDFWASLRLRPVSPDEVARCLGHGSADIALWAVAHRHGMDTGAWGAGRRATIASLADPERASEFVAAEQGVRCLMVQLHIGALATADTPAVMPQLALAAQDAAAEFHFSRDALRRVTMPCYDLGPPMGGEAMASPDAPPDEPLMLGPLPVSQRRVAVPPQAAMRIRLRPRVPQDRGVA